MGKFNVSESVPFWCGDQMIIEEVQSASKSEYFDLQGQPLSMFEPTKKCSLEDFKNRYVIRAGDDWMEFTCF